MKEKKTVRGAICAILAGVCWGFSGTVSQYLFTQKGVDSGWLAVVRMLGAGGLLLAFALARYPRQLKQVWQNRKTARRLILFSLLGLLPCQYTYLAAISHSNSGTATALQYLGQALILAYVCVQARRLPTKKESAAVLLAISGVFLLATHGDIHTLVLSPQALFWGGLAALSLMLYTLLPGDLIAVYSCPVCTGCGMLIGGAAMFFVIRGWALPVVLDAAALLAVAEIILVGTALAFTLYLQSVSDLGGVRASLLACTEPVSAAVFAACWMDTRFAPEDIAGIALILLMAVLLALPERQRSVA